MSAYHVPLHKILLASLSYKRLASKSVHKGLSLWDTNVASLHPSFYNFYLAVQKLRSGACE